MKKIIKSTDSITKLDIINAEASQSFKDMPEGGVEVHGVALVEDVNRDGEVGQFAYLFTPDGEVYGGNSATIYRACDGLIDLIGDNIADGVEKTYRVKVNSRPTSSGREFLTLTILGA